MPVRFGRLRSRLRNDSREAITDIVGRARSEAFYNFTPQWGIGTAPIISVNWDAKGGDKVALPVGLGVTHTFKLARIIHGAA